MKNISLILCFLNLGICFSQSEITWQPSIDISQQSFGNLHPRIAVNAAGLPVIIWGRSSDESVFCTRLENNIFKAPFKLNQSGLTIATQSWMGPDIASKGDTMYVVMKQTPENLSSNHVFIASSFDGGANFNKQIKVDDIVDSLTRFPAIGIDQMGNPIVGFMKFNAAFEESRWVASKSNDLGKTFQKDIKVSAYSSPESTVCDCCPGSIAYSENNIALLYRDNFKNIRDSWASISLNGGDTFNKGYNVDGNNWLINSCPATGPDGAIIGDSLYSVFMNGSKIPNRVYLNVSSIKDGSNINATKALGGNISGLEIQNYPHIATSGKAVAIVWIQRVNGITQLPLIFTNNINKGLPNTAEIMDENDIANADVAIFNNKIYIVWEDDKSGTVKYKQGEFDPDVTLTNETFSLEINVYPNPNAGNFNINSSIIPDEITIHDINGKICYSEKPFSKQTKVKLLSKGIYFVSVIKQGKMASKTICIE